MGRPRKPIYGVGINDAPYNTERSEVVTLDDGTRKRVTHTCPYFKTYKAMMARAYSEVFHKRHPSYKDCSVHPDWHTFMTFKSWMETKDWQGKQLDKDLLKPGNKVYGPDTCCFIDKEVNQFIQHAYGDGSGSLYGVCFCSHTPRPKCQYASKHIGYFDTQEEAHEVWRLMKHENACKLADKQSDPRVSKALRERYADHSICCWHLS